jgi:hypothetical protein
MKSELIALLRGGQAHVPFSTAVEDLPLQVVGVKPPGLPYSIWQLVEHIRIAQADILEFCRAPDYVSPKWPDDYWPAEAAPARVSGWEKSLEEIQSDLDSFIALISDPKADMFTPFSHGQGQNLFREALLIADHTSYHTGEILVIRRLLDRW